MSGGLQKEKLRLYSCTWEVLAQLGAEDREEAACPALASPLCTP